MSRPAPIQLGPARLRGRRGLQRREIAYVREHGERLVGACLVVNRTAAPDGQSRLGLAVGRRYHLSAVRRNRARRLIRESFRLLQGGFREPQWLLVVARAPLLGVRLQTVQTELQRHLTRAGVLPRPTP
jgi:ribonuclease P protein component